MGRIRILCGLTILLAAACSGGTDGASNDTWEILQTDADADAPTAPAVEASVTASPLAVALSFEGQPLAALKGQGGRGAFYVTDGKARVELDGFTEGRTEGAVAIWDGRLADGRAASLRLEARAEGSLALTFSANDLGPKERLGARFEVGTEEGFYGLMERVVQGSQNLSWDEGMTEGLDLRGQEVQLFVLPTISLYAPFYVSSAGYGVRVASDWPGVYRFGVGPDGREASNEVTLEYEGGVLPLEVYPGPTPLDATARYARAVGTSLLPPAFTFRPWRWRDDHWPLTSFFDGTPYDGPFNSMVVEDILMMEALGIPCGLYWVDRPWAKGLFGYDDFEWDTERFPDPIGMIDWLNGRGIEFMLWIAPWAVGPRTSAEAEDRGYGLSPAPPGPAGAVSLDLTNPAAVAWWQAELGARIAENVVGFKLDRGEELVPEGVVFDGVYDDGTPFRAGRNPYPTWYARAVQGAFEAAGVTDYVVMPRAAWEGTQRHAVPWGGDTGPSEWGLRSAIIAVQRAALLNFPIWGSDTCGYTHPTSHEVCGRWLQFSAFTPLMEVGPTGNAAPWSMNTDGLEVDVDRNGYHYEPVWNPELIATYIFYAQLHDHLREYSYAQAVLAHERGIPFVRPMVAVHPDRPEYRGVFDLYYYGPDLLVAPVWQPGVVERRVVLPDDGWVDAWTGQRLAAGDQVVPAPRHKIPIFVRAGSPVDLGDLEARWQSALARAAVKPDLSARDFD